MSDLNIKSIKVPSVVPVILIEALKTNEATTAAAKERNPLSATFDQAKTDFLKSGKHVQLANVKTHYMEDFGEARVLDKPVALELPSAMSNEKLQQLNREIVNGVVTSPKDDWNWSIWDLISKIRESLERLLAISGTASLAEIDYTFKGYGKSVDAANEARTAGLAAGIAGIVGGVLGSGVGVFGTVKSLRASKSLAKIDSPKSDSSQIAADKIKANMERWNSLPQQGMMISQVSESCGKIASASYESNSMLARADSELDSKLTDNMRKNKESAADTSQTLSRSARDIIENTYDATVYVTKPV